MLAAQVAQANDFVGAEQACEEAQMVQAAPQAMMQRKSAGFGFFGGGGAKMSKGVLPVRMEVPGYGTVYRFEKMLVLEEHPSMSAFYKRK